jgi:hypothetical protein
MEEAPIIEYNQVRIDEATNPLGIMRAEVARGKLPMASGSRLA